MTRIRGLTILILGLTCIIIVCLQFQPRSEPGMIEAEQSPHLALVAHPYVPVLPGQNIVWCDTLQLAWNKTIQTVGGKLLFEKQPDLVDRLNAQQYTKDDLAPSDYGIVADLASNGAEKQIQDMIAKRFEGKIDALPQLSHLDPNALVIYAALSTHFSFFPSFAKTAPIQFGGKSVASFGRVAVDDQYGEDIVQVKVCNYKDDSNFIVVVAGNEPGTASKVICQVILAKVTPAATLQETMDTVLGEIAKGDNPYLKDRDELRIPKFNFCITGEFPELDGLKFQTSTSKGQLVSLGEVAQNLHFQMNEYGVELATSGMMMSTAGLTGEKPKHLVFDSPFLLMIQRVDAKQPFLAIWVADPSLLVPAN